MRRSGLVSAAAMGRMDASRGRSAGSGGVAVSTDAPAPVGGGAVAAGGGGGGGAACPSGLLCAAAAAAAAGGGAYCGLFDWKNDRMDAWFGLVVGGSDMMLGFKVCRKSGVQAVGRVVSNSWLGAARGESGVGQREGTKRVHKKGKKRRKR